MSSYLTFYVIPKKTKPYYKKDGTSEAVEVSKGVPLALMSFSRNSNVYQSFYAYLSPTYIGDNEPKYDELEESDMTYVINKLREDLEDAKTRHQNKLKVLGALTGFHDYDTLNQLIDEEDFIKEKEENLNELIWLKSFLFEIKYGDFEEKILMNID